MAASENKFSLAARDPPPPRFSMLAVFSCSRHEKYFPNAMNNHFSSSDYHSSSWKVREYEEGREERERREVREMT